MRMPYRWFLAFSLEMYRRIVEEQKSYKNVNENGDESKMNLSKIRELTKKHET